MYECIVSESKWKLPAGKCCSRLFVLLFWKQNCAGEASWPVCVSCESAWPHKQCWGDKHFFFIYLFFIFLHFYISLISRKLWPILEFKESMFRVWILLKEGSRWSHVLILTDRRVSHHFTTEPPHISSSVLSLLNQFVSSDLWTETSEDVWQIWVLFVFVASGRWVWNVYFFKYLCLFF